MTSLYPVLFDNRGDCTQCGLSARTQSRAQHVAWHNNFIHRSEVKDGFAVSAVKWCDLGNHAFKANIPGAQSMDVTQTNSDGMQERVVMDICPEHAFPNVGLSSLTSSETSTMHTITKAYEAEKNS